MEAENNMKQKVYVTTPIYYVNDKPHIGHFYCNLLADVFARYNVLLGNEVRMLTGTDEHGQKVQRAAEKNGVLPMEFCNNISIHFRKMSVDFNFAVSYEKFNSEDCFNCFDKTTEQFNNSDTYHLTFNNGENFIRTTEGRDKKTGDITEESLSNGRHIKFVQNIWRTLMANGWIYKQQYSGWYAVRDEAFYDEEELIDGKAPTGADVEWREEQNYFFRLSLFKDLLLKLYLNDSLHLFIPEKRLAELISFLKGEATKGSTTLQDLSISRSKREDADGNSFSWGIPVPDDDTQIIYVWLDALFNYISALQVNDKNIYKDFWQNRESKLSINHFIGKEIVRFHAIYWPAFLIATRYKTEEINSLQTSDIENLIYTKIYSHGWWTNEGQKISKSLGNVIDPYNEINWLQTEFGVNKNIAVDYLRYFCIASIPFGNDVDYSRTKLVSVINSEIVNNIGNLIQRVVTLINKPELLNIKDSLDNKFISQVKITKHEDFIASINNADFYNIIKLCNNAANACNAYLDAKAPWALIKIDQMATKTVLCSILHILSETLPYLKPIMPFLSSEMLLSIEVRKITGIMCPRLNK